MEWIKEKMSDPGKFYDYSYDEDTISMTYDYDVDYDLTHDENQTSSEWSGMREHDVRQVKDQLHAEMTQ